MPARLSGHYVMLRAGNLRLLLPQADVGAAEYRAFEPRPSGEPGVFSVEFSGEQHAVIAPSERLRRLIAMPMGRFVLTRLSSATGGALWLAWDEVRVLINASLVAFELPPALRAADMPVSNFVELGDDTAFCCDAASVTAHLWRCEAEVNQ